MAVIYTSNIKGSGARAHVFNQAIIKSQRPVYSLRKIPNDLYELLYVVTLKRDGLSFEERVEKFYRCLMSVKREDEALIFQHRCFIIEGKNYNIVYCLEGYKKNADRVGFVENGECKTELFYRMGYDKAYKWWQKQEPTAQAEIIALMHKTGVDVDYYNPADCFVAAVNTYKNRDKGGEKILKRKSVDFKLLLCLRSIGWLTGSVELLWEKFTFEASYLGAGAEEFLCSVLRTYPDDPKYHGENSFYGDLYGAGEYAFFINQEGSEIFWNVKKNEELSTDGEYYLDIRITKTVEERTELLISATIPYFEYARTVINALDRMLKEVGILGYYKNWGTHFPLSELLFAKNLLKEGEKIYAESANTYHPIEGYDVEEFNTTVTDFKKELALIRKNKI